MLLLLLPLLLLLLLGYWTAWHDLSNKTILLKNKDSKKAAKEISLISMTTTITTPLGK